MNEAKLTFFDLVELEDIDINDPRAKFYLVDVSNGNRTNPGYKFYGTVHLTSLKSDPESRKRCYWPITREELEKADLDTLFPEPGELLGHKKMRSDIFKTVQDVNDVFRFEIPFNPLRTQAEFFDTSPRQDHRFFSPTQQARPASLREICKRVVDQFTAMF